MALAPRVSNTSPPSHVNRLPNFAPFAIDSGMPVEEIDQFSGVYRQGASYYYEDLLADQERNAFKRFSGQNYNRRYINSSLMTGTTKSFSEAFAEKSGVSEIDAKLRSGFNQKTSRGSVIILYESTTNTVKIRTTFPGESLNFSV